MKGPMSRRRSPAPSRCRIARGHDAGRFSLRQMADSLDIVAVSIEHEGAVIIGVIFGPKAWRPIVGAARLKRGMIEGIDRGPALSGEGHMQGPARLAALSDPEERFETGAEADGCTMSSFFRRD